MKALIRETQGFTSDRPELVGFDDLVNFSIDVQFRSTPPTNRSS
jgi:hypothetical protein